MAKTREELINKALSLLQEEGAGQPVGDEDYAKFDEAVAPLLAELSGAEVVTVGNVDEIDDAIFLPLARILMNEVGEDFGRPTSDDFRALQERRIRRVTASGPTYQTMTTDYF